MRAEKSGDDDLKRVRALRKPKVVAWAVNQLVRSERSRMSELIELAQRLSKEGDATQLRELSERRRRVIGDLTEAATDLLKKEGHAATSDTARRISETLLAATGEEQRRLIEQGRLTDELTPSGFEAVAVGAPAGRANAKPQEDRRTERARSLAAAADDAEEEARRLREQASRAQRAADVAAREADIAEKRAVTARRRADEARRKR